MTKDEAIGALMACQENDDVEMAHGVADDVLCAFLCSIGHDDVVAEFMKVPKWYA